MRSANYIRVGRFLGGHGIFCCSHDRAVSTWFSSYIAVVLFDKLAAVLNRIAIYQAPVYGVDDFNNYLDKPDGPHAVQLRRLVETYGLVHHATGPTRQLGGTLGVVITRAAADDERPDDVAVVDIELSDHHLLQESVPQDVISHLLLLFSLGRGVSFTTISSVPRC